MTEQGPFETDLDRQRRERYEKQESKRAPKIQIDQVVTLNAWLTSVLIAFIASAVVSFNGITSVAVDDAARYAQTHSIADPVLLDLEGRYLRDLNDTLSDDLAGAGQTNEPALLSAIEHASE